MTVTSCDSFEEKYYAEFALDKHGDRNLFKHENINDYHKGGLHPVHLNDRLDGRYRVVHKLGYGGYGVVWLCADETEHVWRAVKILSADQSDPEHCQELKVLDVFRRFDRESVLQENHLVLPVDAFTIDGPNGHHVCMVFPLLGPVLHGFQLHYAPCTEILKDVCFQLAQALDFLHSNGLCHGDFRPDNIMFRLADGVDQWPEEKLSEVYGEPQIGRIMVTKTEEEAEPNPGRPNYIVGRTKSKGFRWDSGVISTSIAVGDLGVSFDASNPPQHSRIPVGYATPDAILGMWPPGFTDDIWALMGTVLVVRTGNKRPEDDEGIGADHVLKFCEFVDGPMPQNFRAGWKAMGQEFRNDEKDLTVPATLEADFYHSRIQRLKAKNNGIFDYMKDYVAKEHSSNAAQEYWDDLAKDEEYKATGLLPRWTQPSELDMEGIWHILNAAEVAQLTDLCYSVYKWQPEDRASSKQILDHPWFGGRNKKAQSQYAKADLVESTTAPLPGNVLGTETGDSEVADRHTTEAPESAHDIEITQAENTEHTTSDEVNLINQPENTVAAEAEIPAGTPSNWVVNKIKKWWPRCVQRSHRAWRKR